MSKVTSKLQVTIPKRIAEQFAIKPGDEVEFLATPDGLRVLTATRRGGAALSIEERLRLFDAATARQLERQSMMKFESTPGADRGWTRDELYTRGQPG